MRILSELITGAAFPIKNAKWLKSGKENWCGQDIVQHRGRTVSH
jgi:hypothetical protein